MAEQLLHIELFSVGLTTTLIAAALTVTSARAQTPAALLYDAKVGPIAFGAGDMKTMASLGNCHTERIRGTVALYRYESGGDAALHAQARTHLLAASNCWKQYATQWSSQCVKQVLTRMGLTVVDIAGIQAHVDADIPPEVTGTNRPAKPH